jgi:hypothetical protein
MECSQGQDKAMYFANNHYFLRYDGVKWEKNTLPNQTISARCLRYMTGCIAVPIRSSVTGIARMGYALSISRDRKLFSDNGNEEIWKILLVGSKVYFNRSMRFTFMSKAQLQKSSCLSRFRIVLKWVVNCYLPPSATAYTKCRGIRFVRIDAWAGIANNVVHAIERHKQEDVHLPRRTGYLSPTLGWCCWAHPLNAMLKTSIINAARFINDHTLIIGTASKGFLVLTCAMART